jgi:hypothetical protein
MCQAAAPPRPRVICNGQNFREVGLHQCPSERKGQGVPARRLHVPSHVPSHPQTAAKVWDFSLTAPPFVTKTDWLLEGGVSCELVSEIKIASGAKYDSTRIGNDLGVAERLSRLQISKMAVFFLSLLGPASPIKPMLQLAFRKLLSRHGAPISRLYKELRATRPIPILRV